MKGENYEHFTVRFISRNHRINDCCDRHFGSRIFLDLDEIRNKNHRMDDEQIHIPIMSDEE